jgi:hypothetical protein
MSVLQIIVCAVACAVGTYHSLKRILALLLACLALILAFLSFWWHFRSVVIAQSSVETVRSRNAGKKLAESRPTVMSLSITEKLHVLLDTNHQARGSGADSYRTRVM